MMVQSGRFAVSGGGGDPLFGDVGFLSEFLEGSLTDLSANAMPMLPICGPTIRFDSPKFGMGYMKSDLVQTSVYRDNSGGSELNLRDDDFCIEFWFRRSTVMANTQPMAGRYSTSGSSHRCFMFRYNNIGSGQISFLASTDGSTVTHTATYRFVTDGLTTIFDGDWHHIAAVRSAGVITLYLDGDPGGVTASIGTDSVHNSGSVYFCLGGTQSSTLTSYTGVTNADFDSCRITIGVPRYTAAFTPPTAAFPTDVTGDADFASVALLLNFDQYAPYFKVGDHASDAFVHQPASNVTNIDSRGLLRRTTSTIPARWPADTVLDLGSADFTLELFGHYFTSSTSGGNVVGSWNTAVGKRGWRIRRRTSTILSFSYSTDGTNETDLDFATSFATSTNYDLLVARSGSTLYLYVNGVLDASHSLSATIFNPSCPLSFFGGHDGTTSSGGDATESSQRLKAIRLTNGVARYAGVGSYGVPTLPLPKAA
jgi:hypothetical protein